MSEQIKQLSILLCVDTDRRRLERRRLERVIVVPDGAPHLETAFLVRQALSTLGNAWWHEVPKGSGA